MRQLASGRSKQASLKSADSIKRFTYLLGQTDLFKHFCDLKAQRDPMFAKLLAEAESAGKQKGRCVDALSRPISRFAQELR